MTSSISRRQSGAAMIVALMFLVVLTMLGVSALSGTTLEEKMAGSTRDRALAMQAAEAALRDAEKDLNNTNTAFRVIQTANFVAACTAGLCLTTCTAVDTCAATDMTKLDFSTGTSTSAYYGQFTGDTSFTGSATNTRLPRYVIELLTTAVVPGVLNPTPHPTAPNPPYNRLFRITSVGYGKGAGTNVILQEIYFMPL
jgi:type IV pilus assembly protein PilX